MSFECGICERDMRGGHADDCPRKTELLPTPRSDAKEKETMRAADNYHGARQHAHYGWKFARQLERELIAATRPTTAAEVERVARAICRNICGYAPPADEVDWRNYTKIANDCITAMQSNGENMNANTTQQDYEHFLSYSGLQHSDLLRYTYFHGADETCEPHKQNNNQIEIIGRAISDNDWQNKSDSEKELLWIQYKPEYLRIATVAYQSMQSRSAVDDDLKKVCGWSTDSTDDEEKTFQTGCGHEFRINWGKPSDQGMDYCCYCGNPLDDSVDDDEQHDNGNSGGEG